MTTANPIRNLPERYRPRTLDEMVGQHAVVRGLRAMIAGGLLDGGLLFQGTTGTGKTTAARALLNELGVDRFWDYQEVKAAECSMEKVREIAKGMRFAAKNGGYRVWLVDEAHRMSATAIDAWKTLLEDLLPNRIVIFATTERERFARERAFRHRCQVFDFEMPTADDLRTLLERAVRAEGLKGIDIGRIAEEAEGSYRQALRLLQHAAAMALAGIEVEPTATPATVTAKSKPKRTSRARTTRTCGTCGVGRVHARGLCTHCYNKARRLETVAAG